MDRKKEKTKRNTFFILQIVFTIISFIGAGYVIINNGEPNAGYAVIPMIWALIFGMFFRNSQKALHGNKEK